MGSNFACGWRAVGILGCFGVNQLINGSESQRHSHLHLCTDARVGEKNMSCARSLVELLTNKPGARRVNEVQHPRMRDKAVRFGFDGVRQWPIELRGSGATGATSG